MALAKTRLSPKATYVQHGYGYVEGNKLSARYNGKIFAQLPAHKDIQILENGMFLKYDYANRVCNFGADVPGEYLLVFNEVKLYDDNRQTDADFAMIRDNYEARVYNAAGESAYRHYGLGGIKTEPELVNDSYGMMPEDTIMVPRLFKTDLGDIFTTNTIKLTSDDETGLGQIKVGAVLKVDDADGYLTYLADKPTAEDVMQWQIVRVYTMPDLQRGVKIMRVK